MQKIGRRRRRWRKNGGAVGAASVKMTAPQAPLMKYGGAAGATKWNAAPQALLSSNRKLNGTTRQDTPDHLLKSVEVKVVWLQ